MSIVQVTRTYLEMTSPEQLRGAASDARLRVERTEGCPASFYRYLYRTVGERYHWMDRAGWSDEEITRYLATPGVSVWVGYVGGVPAGWLELCVRGGEGSEVVGERRNASNAAGSGNGRRGGCARGGAETEIVYFGLIPEFVGRGLGKALLTEAVGRAWQERSSSGEATGRVWLHTCTLDHPAALANYRGRGFGVVREEAYETKMQN